MEAKKCVDRTTEGEYELIKNHVVQIDVDQSLLKKAIDICGLGNDPEDAYFNFGIAFDFDCDVAFIELRDLLKRMPAKLKENEDIMDISRFMEMLETLEAYVEYTLYFDTEEASNK